MARTAIVSGASRSIGRSIAKRLAKDGFAVVVNYAGNASGRGHAGTVKSGLPMGVVTNFRSERVNRADQRLRKTSINRISGAT